MENISEPLPEAGDGANAFLAARVPSPIFGTKRIDPNRTKSSRLVHNDRSLPRPTTVLFANIGFDLEGEPLKRQLCCPRLNKLFFLP